MSWQRRLVPHPERGAAERGGRRVGVSAGLLTCSAFMKRAILKFVVEQVQRDQSKCPLNLAVLLPVAKVDAEKQLSFSISLARMPGRIRASTSS